MTNSPEYFFTSGLLQILRIEIKNADSIPSRQPINSWLENDKLGAIINTPKNTAAAAIKSETWKRSFIANGSISADITGYE